MATVQFKTSRRNYDEKLVTSIMLQKVMYSIRRNQDYHDSNLNRKTSRKKTIPCELTRPNSLVTRI